MLLNTFVMGGPLLHCFSTLCSNFRVKRGWARDTYTMVCAGLS